MTWLLDIHLHGGGGFSAEDGPDAIAELLAVHRSLGTSHAVVSLVTAPIPSLVDNLAQLASLVGRVPGLMGAHLEGPFLNAAHGGAHDPALLRAPDPESVELLIEAGAGTLRMVTIAPELPGADDAIDRFVAAGVVVAVGHTAAGYDQSRAAFDRGASVLTHAFNGMPGLHHRAPGPVLAAIAASHVAIELIADGHHVHPELAAALFDWAPGRVALVSDAMAAAGAGDGDYVLGGRDVAVRDGVARLVDGGSLAGSTLTLAEAVRRIVDAGVDPERAMRAASIVPAAALGLGSLT